MSKQQGVESPARKVKCVIWDLDNTLWNGVLLENESVQLREEAANVVRALDNRGILHSIASRNDEAAAQAKLKEFGLLDYFLYPQIGWRSKSASVEAIGQSLNIGQDALAFIDDDPFEREEVSFSLPDVLCIDSSDLGRLLIMPEMTPGFITEDSRSRRQMYIRDAKRQELEDEFSGPREEFLASLGMVFTIAKVRERDLERVEELTQRTNQLNTTGYTYSYEQLTTLSKSPDHLLLIAGLEDRFGSYGKIGLALVCKQPDRWMILLLLMSCRVMSRGVGSILLNHIVALSRREGVRLFAEFVPNGRNRMMYATYKFANFGEVERRGETVLLESRTSMTATHPDYITVRDLDGQEAVACRSNKSESSAPALSDEVWPSR